MIGLVSQNSNISAYAIFDLPSKYLVQITGSPVLLKNKNTTGGIIKNRKIKIDLFLNI